MHGISSMILAMKYGAIVVLLFNVMSEILATKAFKSNFSGVGGCGRDSWLTTFQLRFFVCYLFVCLFYGSVLIPTQAFIGPL